MGTLALLGAGPGARAAASGGNFVLNPSANGGYIDSFSDTSYALAVAGTPPGISATANVLSVGQFFMSDEGSVWDIRAAYLEFDVSSISGTVAAGTKLSLYVGGTDNSDTDFTLEARTRDYGSSLTTADWVGSGAALAALTLLTSKTTSSITTNAYNDFTESGTALRDAVTTAKAGSGLVRMLICSSRHRGLNEPAGDEYLTFDSIGGTNKPRLTVVTS